MCREGIWKLGDLGMIKALPPDKDFIPNFVGTQYVFLFFFFNNIIFCFVFVYLF